MPQKTLLIFIFTFAFLVRMFFVPNPGFEADVSFWKSWGLAARDFGIVEGVKITNNNYPTPFSYTMGLMVNLYSIFKDPHNFNEFWQNTNTLFLLTSKIFPILADFGIAAIILYIGRNAASLGFPQIPSIGYQILAFIFLLNPVTIIDGAWWGQVDSLGVFIFLIALVLALKRQSFLAGFVFMFAMMTKLQNMIYGPLFFLLVWQLSGFPGLIRVAAGALAGFFGLNIEFFITRNMDRVIASLTENFDYFPWMSLNAFNLWWIVSGAHGMEVSDKISVLGISNAKTIGLLIFSCLYLFALTRLAFTKNAGILKAFFESLIIVNGAFFLFQSQSHDRYAFPLSVFLLLWFTFIHKKFVKILFIFYGLFTIFYFYNLHTALVFNYPKNGLPILTGLISPFLTISTSIVLICLFCIFLWVLVRASKTSQYLFLATVMIVVGGLVMLNKPLFTKTPVSLLQFKPFISRQDYGGRQTNMNVNSSFGIQSWTRLSVQYAFYPTGIGTHANSLHTYDINRKFHTFSTDYGIDTDAGPQGSAIYEIYGDNRLLFRSGLIGRFDMPKHVDIDVTGVKNLSLVTTDSGNGNVNDHTNWLNPILYP